MAVPSCCWRLSVDRAGERGREDVEFGLEAGVMGAGAGGPAQGRAAMSTSTRNGSVTTPAGYRPRTAARTSLLNAWALSPSIAGVEKEYDSCRPVTSSTV